MPSEADDLWATQMLITWIGCPDDRFRIAPSVTDPMSLLFARKKVAGESWECEIQGIEDPVLRPKLGSLRKAMWNAISSDPKPYDRIRSLIKHSLELLSDHGQGSS
jgi:hypothetical protein